MATSWRNKKNYPLGVGTLNTAIDDNDLTIVLDAGQGASFPSASFTISIDEEIILIDSRSTDTLTVNASGRGYDDSTASAHAAGVAIANYQIKKDFTDLEAAINGIENGTTTLAKVITSGSAASTMTVDDSGTNTAVSILELYHTSSGTPASGLGAKLLLGAEDSAGNKEAAIELHGILTTVTNTSEQGKFLLRVKNAGSFMDALEITVASNTVTIGSNQATVNLWNTTTTTVNAFGVATAITMGADSNSGAHFFRGKTFNFGCVNTNADVNLVLTELQNNTNPAAITYQKARYSAGLNAIQANDYIGTFNYSGYTSGAAYSGAAAVFRVQALDNFTGSATGTKFLFECTPSGSTTRAVVLTVANAGSTFDSPLNVNGNLTMGNANNIVVNTSTGTKIGTGTTQKIGFWNATPIVQPASANQAALSLDVDVTGADTVDKAAINTNFTNIQTLVNQLRSDLVAAGLIKGAA